MASANPLLAPSAERFQLAGAALVPLRVHRASATAFQMVDSHASPHRPSFARPRSSRASVPTEAAPSEIGRRPLPLSPDTLDGPRRM